MKDLHLLGFPKKNNIEWLRIGLALQVVFGHAALHLGYSVHPLLGNFPGVPAFFYVSGFLVYASYLNAPGFTYYQNRFLRLFPGLLLVTVGGVILALVAHDWHDLTGNIKLYTVWFFSQITVGQAYNPDHFRNIGVGVLNGALWTITVEILFYLMVPLIVVLEKKYRAAIVLFFIISFTLYAIGPSVFDQNVYKNKKLFDFLALTPLVWGWMFFAGILTAKYFLFIKPHIKYLPYMAIPLSVMIAIGGENIFFGISGNRLGLFYFLCYACLILWVAFGIRYFSLKSDFSYGTYIWHSLVINAMLLFGVKSMSLAVILTLLLATISWFLVEKPALKVKHKTLHLVGA